MAVTASDNNPVSRAAQQDVGTGWVRPPAAPQGSLATTGETVTVALKYPVGVYIQAEEMVDQFEQTSSGGRMVKVARRVGPRVLINGNAYLNHVPANTRDQLDVNGGYALTHGVPKDVWLKWLAANRNSDLVRNGLIEAFTSHPDAQREAISRADLESGYEPIDPSNPGKRTGLNVQPNDSRGR